MKANDPKELKELESENARLKLIVADLTLDNDVLSHIASPKFWPRTPDVEPSTSSRWSSGCQSEGPVRSFISRSVQRLLRPLPTDDEAELRRWLVAFARHPGGVGRGLVSTVAVGLTG